MLSPEKVATPLTAASVLVPDSVPLLAFVPIATVTSPLNPVAVLSFASSAVTCTAGVIAAPAVVVLGCTLNTSWVADPALTTIVAVCVIATVLIVAETVFDPATVELRVPVATPLASVTPEGCVSLFPEPVAARTTVAPAIGLPKGSLAVTVIVDVAPPAMIGDVATTVDWLADKIGRASCRERV